MPYAPQAMPQPVVVKVHKRTFWLTIAQIIIIVKAILVILLAAASVAIGVYILAAGHDALRNIPGYDNYANQFGNAFVNAAGAVFFVIAIVPLIIGIVDLILGIIVGRPSNVARWIIVVLDILSILIALSDFARVNSSTGDLIIIVYLVLQVLVLYAMLRRPGNPSELRGQGHLAFPASAPSLQARSPLEVEVAVHEPRRERARVGVDGFDAGAAQHAQRVVAICDESACDRASIGIVAGARHGVRRVIESRIANGDDEREMPAAQANALPDQRFSLVGIEHVGEDDHEGAASLPPAEEPERVVVVGLGLARQDRSRRVQEAAELRRAGARRQRVGDRVREREHPGAIAAAQRDMHEQQRGVDCVVELGELARRRFPSDGRGRGRPPVAGRARGSARSPSAAQSAPWHAS